jgi:hypothetical protein
MYTLSLSTTTARITRSSESLRSVLTARSGIRVNAHLCDKTVLSARDGIRVNRDGIRVNRQARSAMAA